MKQSCGRYILLLNPDTVVLKEAFAKMVKFMNCHDEIGISGCKIIDVDGKAQFSCGTFPNLWTLFCEFSFLDRMFPRSKVFSPICLVPFSYQLLWIGVLGIRYIFLVKTRDKIKDKMKLCLEIITISMGACNEGFISYSDSV